MNLAYKMVAIRSNGSVYLWKGQSKPRKMCEKKLISLREGKASAAVYVPGCPRKR